MSSLQRTYSVPGKTFLIGEYLALHGGPSILLSTAPRFVLRAGLKGRPAKTAMPFAPKSPAGRLLAKANMSAARFDISDPHLGQGGMGASSAQFILSYAALNSLSASDILRDLSCILEKFRDSAFGGEGFAPSGADVAAQLTGGVCCFDGRSVKIKNFSWAFDDLVFSLIRTNLKLATHEHLKELPDLPLKQLGGAVAQAIEAFETNDGNKLISAVNSVGGILSQNNLTLAATQGIIQALRSQVSGVLAVKGCGAMGADVILVLHRPEPSKKIKVWAESKGLSICGDFKSLDARGLTVEGDSVSCADISGEEQRP